MAQSQSQTCTVLVSGFYSEQKLGVMRKQYRLCQYVSIHQVVYHLVVFIINPTLLVCSSSNGNQGSSSNGGSGGP